MFLGNPSKLQDIIPWVLTRIKVQKWLVKIVLYSEKSDFLKFHVYLRGFIVVLVGGEGVRGNIELFGRISLTVVWRKTLLVVISVLLMLNPIVG